ncbi:MAG: hypothetical protein HS111_21930 [Kofleriaceae bacterium]|nr:hypothetical protein [Kofleriaceae bacterium]MCL4224352.1 hypothetical protein [Myxococcales bacterium]
MIAIIVALVGLLIVRENSASKERRALERALKQATDDKADACDSARTRTTIVLYALRGDDDRPGVDRAQMHAAWMRYCDGERGTALAREIDDAIIASIPRSRDDNPPPLDVERIVAALTTFSKGAQ